MSEKSAKKENVKTGTKRAHRFKPGTVALRDIRSQQRNSGVTKCIPPTRFERIVKKIMHQEFREKVKFTASSVQMLQMILESHLIDLCVQANKCAIHAGRETLKKRDISLAKSIKGCP